MVAPQARRGWTQRPWPRLRRQWRAGARLIAATGHLLRGAVLARGLARLSTPQREVRIQWWSMRLLQVLGVRLELRGRLQPGSALLVANHVSWLDIMALHAAFPHLRFVAKADVREWPLIGPMAAAAGTLFVDRHSAKRAAGMVDELVSALREGSTIAVFPEGTTSDGHRVLEFHGILLHSAVLCGCAVQPLALRYSDARHAVSPSAPYIGDTSLLRSLWHICAAEGLVVRLQLLDPHPAPHADRRSLARRARLDIATCLGLPPAP